IRHANSRYEDVKETQPLNVKETRKLLKNKDGEELKSKFAGKVRIGDKEVSFEGLAMLLETMNPRETDQIPVSFNKSSFDISEEDKRSFEGLLDDI
ncbi:24141_t:CDS:2, partial [Racocetra persica]